MRKINETYQHEGTGIEFEIEFSTVFDNLNEPNKTEKKVKIMPSANSGWVRGDKGFVFNRSKPEVIQKIGRALLEIGEFCEKL